MALPPSLIGELIMNKELAKAKAPNKSLEKKVEKLEKVVGFINRKLEDYFGEDFNGDGKIGNIRIGALAAIAILSVATALGVSQSSSTIWNVTDSTATNDVAQIDSSGNLALDGTITASGAITAVPTDSGSITSTLSASTTAVEAYPQAHKTVLTMADTPLLITATATTNAWGSVKIYDFPAGRLLIQGVTVDGIDIEIDTNSLTIASEGDFAFGTVAASTNALSSTMVDLCPSTSIAAITTVVNSALSASAQFDGTSTAKDMYLNFAIDNGDQTVSTIATNTVDGVVTIHWLDLGDY